MRPILIILALCCATSVSAQPPVKLYAFSQHFTPGNIPVDMNEGDRERKPVGRTEYYIYLSVPAGYTVSPIQMRIGKEWFKVSSKIIQSPVYADQPMRKLLVPATANRVYQLEKGEPAQSNTTVSTKWKDAELVLSYKWKGRMWTVGAHKIKMLPRVEGL